MAAWVWLVAYLAGFALVQVLLYRYFRDSHGGRTAPRGSESEGVRVPPERGGDADGDGVYCRHCGARNGAGYTYCRQCAQQL